MAVEKEYIVPFVGLSNGKHEYRFVIERSFFDAFECPEIRKSNIVVDMVLNKEASMLLLTFSLKGTVNILCDRCADYFDLSVKDEQKLIFKLESKEYLEEEDIVYLTHGTSELNLKQHIYEYALLSIPQRRVHGETEDGTSLCNGETLKKLEEIITENKPVDPRWEILKKLKN